MSFLSYVKEANVRQHHIVVQPSRPVAGDPPKQGPAAPSVRLVEAAGPVGTDPNLELVSSVHRSVVDELTTLRESVSDSVVDDAQLRRHVEQYAESQLADAAPTMPRATRGRLVADIADEVLGLGPLAPLLRDPSITEIVVNGHDQVFCERGGRLEPADCSFRSNDHIIEVVQRILWPIGRRLDLASPMVDARLPDGSRLNAIIPPLSLHGPAVTIRKFSGRFLRAEDLITHGTISASALTFLAACVRARLNILVSGGTGSGKTTLLNVLGGFAFPHERIITIEDPAELQIHHRDLVSLETRPPNIDGTGQVVQRDLLKNALRMRPDRIIVGECRGPEAFDMMQAMNTGHDGSMTTTHASSPRDAFSRLETMVMMATQNVPDHVIRQMLASAIQIVIHCARLGDGTRKVTAISEVSGVAGDQVEMQDVFLLHRSGVGPRGQVLGAFAATGARPHCLDRLKAYGIRVPQSIFSERRELKGL